MFELVGEKFRNRKGKTLNPAQTQPSSPTSPLPSHGPHATGPAPPRPASLSTARFASRLAQLRTARPAACLRLAPGSHALPASEPLTPWPQLQVLLPRRATAARTHAGDHAASQPRARTPRPPPPYKKGPQPLPYPSPSPPPPVNPSAPPPCCSAAPLLCIAAVSPPCRSTARHDPRNSSAVCPGPTPSTLPPIPDPAIDGIAWILSPVRSLAPPRFHPAGAVRPELTPVLAS